MTEKELAEKIADEMFKNGVGEVADRLVLTKDGAPPSRSLGGWGRVGFVHVVAEVLRQHKLR